MLALVLALLGPVPSPAPAAPAEQTVTFVTTDQVRVEGTMVGRGPVGVVFGHMLGGTRRDWFPFARRLSSDGYVTLAFDFRGHGRTRGPSALTHLERDMLAAAAFLKARGVQRVVLVGASMGGTAALKAASMGDAAALVVISSPMAFGADVTSSDLARIAIPTLWIVGRDDADFTRPMRTMYNGVKGPKTLHVYPGAWHGTQFFTSPHGPDVSARIHAFAAKHVPPR